MRPPLRYDRARGFTLVELMVALTGGLFVAVAVFSLAREGTTFHQRESRLATATFSGLVGFQRLRLDLARAGFLSSPNVRSDPSVCGYAPATWADGLLEQLTSLKVVDGGSATNPTLTANNLAPDRVVLAGSFASGEQFPITTVEVSGTTYRVYLQPNSGPIARAGISSNETLQAVFGTDRGMRIIDRTGRTHFGIISTAVWSATAPYVVLKDSIPLTFRASGTTCGLHVNEVGALANVVNFIRYDVRPIAATAAYDQLDDAYAVVPGFDTDRTELVRGELTATSTVDSAAIAGTEELVAEYTVDLDLGLTVVDTLGTSGVDPVLTHLRCTNGVGCEAGTSLSFGDFGGTSATPATQRVRGVRARLAVRTRAPDRPGPHDDGTRLYRVALGAAGAGPYARVRTFQADVALRNHSGVTW
ncbi:MAG: prepilin-type N-terminal cleavage/methylation domain-containing protein [Polyangiaceae bacterium]|nr:prepilin-type N-terminal cleavage/methylation domain-containing protein [Polyangiaceae bacterium]